MSINQPNPPQRRHALRMQCVFALTVLAILSGCGGQTSATGGPDQAQPGPSGQYPLVLTTADGEITIEQKPTRIVSLSPTATEMLFAIGAGDQVEAVGQASNYPKEAPATKLSGFKPNTEAIAATSPDLVVMAGDAGPGATATAIDALEAVDIPVLLAPAATSMDDAYRQIEMFGKVTGHPDEAAQLINSMRTDIAEAIDSASDVGDLTVYHELGPMRFSATSQTFIGQIYADFGLTNIADAAAADTSGYPQLSAEFIVTENPDLIFLSGAKQSPEKVAARPGWARINAIRQDAVILLDHDVATRWGPRIVDIYRQVAATLNAKY